MISNGLENKHIASILSSTAKAMKYHNGKSHFITFAWQKLYEMLYFSSRKRRNGWGRLTKILKRPYNTNNSTIYISIDNAVVRQSLLLSIVKLYFQLIHAPHIQ